MLLTIQDEQDLRDRGISPDAFLEQLHRFLFGTIPAKLERPCAAGDGILVLSPTESHRLLDFYERARPQQSIVKFVPASGAASRMFRHLLAFNPSSLSELTEEFILHFSRFPFVRKLEKHLENAGLSLNRLVHDNQWEIIFDHILSDKGLGYAQRAKGNVEFHRYPDGARTALEEQMMELFDYGKGLNDQCRIHFTVSPVHLEAMEELARDIQQRHAYDAVEISFSVQSPSTDVVALDTGGNPERDAEERLLFRPSGHGALLKNLQQVEADLVFIKNIDNVTMDHQRMEGTLYKKILGGLLLELKETVFRFLQWLDEERSDAAGEAIEFIQNWFQPGLPIGMNRDQLRQYARMRLDRPLRVCGMVRNEGEPGGGPFWVKMPDGHISKQIVEKHQTDQADANQQRMFAASTHFNPVDIACSFRNRRGENYDLSLFVDHSTGFVSEKFQEGRVIRAPELPGLWNGSMALWNTVFVEVPVSTFHPVKTVNDLLRPGHQPA